MNTPICTVEIVQRDYGWLVQPVWPGVDRPTVGGYGTGSKRQLAERLKAFIESGQAWVKPPQVRTDINGKTYVQASIRINCRFMNAELKRFGF